MSSDRGTRRVLWGFISALILGALASCGTPTPARAACISQGAWVGGTFYDGPPLCASDLNNNNAYIATVLSPASLLATSNSWAQRQIFPAASTKGSINLFPGGTPSAPSNGDMWTTTAGLFVRINGSTVGPLAGTGALGTAAYQNIGTSGANVPLLNGANTWSGINKWSLPWPTTDPLIISATAGDGIVSARSTTMLQIVGTPNNFAVTPEVNAIDAFGYNGFPAVDLERYDRGTATTNGSTSTSSPTLHFAAVPDWLTANSFVFDNGNPIGTVMTWTSTTITLTGNAMNPVGSGDLLNIIGPNNGAVQNGEAIGSYTFAPYDGQSDAVTAGISATATQTQDWMTNTHGTSVTLYYTPNSAGTNRRYTGITISHGGLGGITLGDEGFGVPPADMGAGTTNFAASVYVVGNLIATINHLHGEKSGLPVVDNSGVVTAGSSDNAGEVTGGSAATTWTIGWHTNWTLRPFCTVTPLGTTGGLYTVTPSVSSLIVTFASATNDGFDWTCL